MKHDGWTEQTLLRSTECYNTRVRIGKLVARRGRVLPHIGWLRLPLAIARTINQHNHFTKKHPVPHFSHVMFVIAARCALHANQKQNHEASVTTLLPCMHVAELSYTPYSQSNHPEISDGNLFQAIALLKTRQKFCLTDCHRLFG